MKITIAPPKLFTYFVHLAFHFAAQWDPYTSFYDIPFLYFLNKKHTTHYKGLDLALRAKFTAIIFFLTMQQITRLLAFYIKAAP